MMKLIRQLLVEFWIPILLSIGWTLYKFNGNICQISIKDGIETLIPAFFLISWFTGQVIRVKKQQGVKSDLEKIVNRFDEVIDRLEQTTDLVIDNLTGRKSYVFATLNINDTDLASMHFIHGGNSPVYDIHVRLVDVKEYKILKGGNEFNLNIGTMAPRTAKPGVSFKIPKVDELEFSIFFSNNAGIISQSLKLKKVDEQWKRATQVSNNYGTVYIQIDKDFPIDGDEQVLNWIDWKKELDAKKSA